MYSLAASSTNQQAPIFTHVRGESTSRPPRRLPHRKSLYMSPLREIMTFQYEKIQEYRSLQILWRACTFTTVSQPPSTAPIGGSKVSRLFQLHKVRLPDHTAQRQARRGDHTAQRQTRLDDNTAQRRFHTSSKSPRILPHYQFTTVRKMIAYRQYTTRNAKNTLYIDISRHTLAPSRCGQPPSLDFGKECVWLCS